MKKENWISNLEGKRGKMRVIFLLIFFLSLSAAAYAQDAVSKVFMDRDLEKYKTPSEKTKYQHSQGFVQAKGQGESDLKKLGLMLQGAIEEKKSKNPERKEKVNRYQAIAFAQDQTPKVYMDADLKKYKNPGDRSTNVHNQAVMQIGQKRNGEWGLQKEIDSGKVEPAVEKVIEEQVSKTLERKVKVSKFQERARQIAEEKRLRNTLDNI